MRIPKFILLSLAFLLGCTQPQEQAKSTKTNTTPTQSIQTKPVESKEEPPEKEEETDTPESLVDTTNLTDQIRPGKTLVLNKNYRDTIQFLWYNVDYDYYMLIGKKNGKEVVLNITWEVESQNKYDFKFGDVLLVDWKIDRIIHAGDEELIDYASWGIEAEKLNEPRKIPITIDFLWWEDEYDSEIDSDISMIQINRDFCEGIGDKNRAALGYVATFIGNQCAWDGKANDDRSNLQCKVLTALDLGYQCSDKHLGFLRNSFAWDEAVLKNLEICGTTPDGATVQTTFAYIKYTLTTDNRIVISYKVEGINTAQSRGWSWDQTDTFEEDGETLRLVQSERTDLVIEEIDMGEH